ncbi:MAG: co-chaperone GroES [Clostridia bacterium]|nr:co-chaperone GroES [Clostridia bacterium]
MKIVPLFDKIVIKPVEAEKVTAGGLILPNTNQEKPQIAEVIAVGNGETFDGKTQKMQVAVGDKVLYPKYAGSEFKFDGVDYVILSQSDLLGKIKD